ncbi:MAG TPA: FtsX-like permease family protein [Geothrix sp.]|nr:FtsX-like permease family protein [Geothrix sp.]
MRFALRMALREAARQKGRLLVIALCLAVGFAAFFATYGFSARVLSGIRAESRSLLGADFSITSTGPFPEEVLQRAAALPGIQGHSLVYDFVSMAHTGEGEAILSRLVEVRAVDGRYPLVGRLELNGVPPTVPPRVGGSGAVFVERGLADPWGLRSAPPGSLASHTAVGLGDGFLPVGGVIALDESRQASAFTMGPRVLVDRLDAERLGLLTARSRFSGKLLLTLVPGADADQVRAGLEALVRGSAQRLRLRSHEEAATALARPIRNLNRFVQQLGLATLLLAMLGAWAILTAFLEARSRDAAILRCLGAAPLEPARIYGLLTVLLLIVALALGLAAGLGVAALIPRWLGDLFPAVIGKGSAAAPPLLETLLAVGMIALLTLPPLVRLGDVKPLMLLREGADLRGGRAWLSRGCAALAFLLSVLLIVRNAPSLMVGLGTALGMALLFLLLYGAARLLLFVYRRSANAMPLSLRLAFGQLGARRGLTSLMMAVMGLAVFLTTASQFIKDDIVAPIAAQQGAGNRPNLFFMDVQSTQWRQVAARLQAETGREPLEAPIVRARLAAIGGRPVREAQPQRPGEDPGEQHGEGFRNREQNLTWRDRPGSSEAIVAGRFWQPNLASADEISLEQGFADAIGAKLGDELTFDVSGNEVKGRVTSLRKVQWQSFQPNFFIVMHPSVLAGAPAVHLLATEADPAAKGRVQVAMARDFPNITIIDVTDVVAKVGRVLDIIALITRTLAALMLASALLVLTASLIAGRMGRQRDLAMLRTIGASHGTLLRSLAWEFLLLGGSSAVLATALAWGLARVYTSRVLELPTHPGIGLGLLLMVASALLTLVVGVAGSLRVLNAKPMDVLRGE